MKEEFLKKRIKEEKTRLERNLRQIETILDENQKKLVLQHVLMSLHVLNELIEKHID